MEGVVVWLLTGRLSGAALAPLRVTQEVVVKAVSPEVLDELRRLFSSVPPSERTAQTPSASASKTPGSATPTENASDDDVDACLRHFAALSPDGKISRTQLRTLPAVEWVITVRNRNTNKDALETRLPDSVHDGIRRGRGKRANRD
jgi:hypothetical protein